jgi:hypothetical protein
VVHPRRLLERRLLRGVQAADVTRAPDRISRTHARILLNLSFQPLPARDQSP